MPDSIGHHRRYKAGREVKVSAAYLVRFADDFLIMFQYERDAQRVYEAITKRMELFGLELSKEKTRILPFGRNSVSRETFDFLGFTHFNSKTRKGYYSVGHKISRKKRSNSSQT